MTLSEAADTQWAWRARARCAENDVDPVWFFPAQWTGPAIRAKAVCAVCPVIEACLEYALVHHDDGVWGGLSPEERKVERRRRGMWRGALTPTGGAVGTRVNRRSSRQAWGAG